jgi:hypothetical protein
MVMSVPESIKYRREFVASFNTSVSLLKDRFTTESMDMGRSAVFDVTAVGGRMEKRGIDGRIPRTNVSDTQVTVTLDENVKKFEVTDFEKFTSQSDERAKMSHRMMESVNQELDYNILNEMANATQEYAASASAITTAIANKAVAKFGAQQIAVNPNDVTWIVSPYLNAKLMDIQAYTSSDYINSKPYDGNSNQFENQRKIKSWLDIGWIVHPNLPGVGTSSCTTYLVHRRAFGCAVPTNQIKYSAGYDDQDHYHYCSSTVKLGSKILQSAGVMKFYNDDTA